jgi:superfamily II DNA helicase RecQ
MFKYKFFTVPAEGDARLESELNAFLCGHSVVDVKQEYHAASGANGTWCFCIRWRDKPGGVDNAPTKGRTDYKEILEEGDFTLYLRLRDLRKEVASREQVPAFTVFTNEQLAEMAKCRPSSAASFKKLAGVGDSRYAKYGAEFVKFLEDYEDGSKKEGGSEKV